MRMRQLPSESRRAGRWWPGRREHMQRCPMQHAHAATHPSGQHPQGPPGSSGSKATLPCCRQPSGSVHTTACAQSGSACPGRGRGGRAARGSGSDACKISLAAAGRPACCRRSTSVPGSCISPAELPQLACGGRCNNCWRPAAWALALCTQQPPTCPATCTSTPTPPGSSRTASTCGGSG